jgi:hypothetical protein
MTLLMLVSAAAGIALSFIVTEHFKISSQSPSGPAQSHKQSAGPSILNPPHFQLLSVAGHTHTWLPKRLQPH